ncbi:MAG: DNRLRE domain-containing protein [Pirellulaceae bacterium]|nr:DNRLRE domain-containing protein [Planctomycetales bacterium]
MRRAIFGSLLSTILSCSICVAESITMTAMADNTMFSESSNSGGLASTLFAGRNNAAGIRRALLQFDVAGSLPISARISAVQLTLHVDGAAQTETESREFALHRLTSGWGEGTSGGGGPGGGRGESPTIGDATWQHRFYDAQFWTTEGGDFVQSASGSASVGLAPGPYTWQSSAGLVADVQTWLDDPASDFGWMLIGDEQQNGTVRRIFSRESTDPALRPKLTVEYVAVPEPASAILLSFAGLGAGFLRRK